MLAIGLLGGLGVFITSMFGNASGVASANPDVWGEVIMAACVLLFVFSGAIAAGIFYGGRSLLRKIPTLYRLVLFGMMLVLVGFAFTGFEVPNGALIQLLVSIFGLAVIFAAAMTIYRRRLA